MSSPGSTDIADLSGNGKGVGFVDASIAAFNAVTPQQFGAPNDGVGGDGAGINTALAYLNSIKANTLYGYSKGSPKLYLPASQYPYIIDEDIDVYHTLQIEWENGAGPSGGAAVWLCDDGVTGLRTHSNTSVGRNGEGPNRGYSAVGTVLRNPFIIGGFSGIEGESYGIQMRTKTTIYDPYIEGFAGDGIYGNTSGVDNINGSMIWNPFVIGNRRGIYINQNNANALQIHNPQMFVNRADGLVIENGYGGSVYGGNSAGNGETTFALRTQCWNNGHIFGVLYGQEVWCSTNSPPSTATNNQGWFYLFDIGAPQPHAAQWVTGQTWRSANAIRVTGGSSRGSILGHEVETGQMPIMVTGGGRMFIPGGLQGGGNPITETGALYGGFLDQDSSGFYVNGIFPPADNVGNIGVGGTRFQKMSAYRMDAKTWYAVNGVDVVGPRGASLPVNATDLATVITLANAIKARMKATGGHGLVDD